MIIIARRTSPPPGFVARAAATVTSPCKLGYLNLCPSPRTGRDAVSADGVTSVPADGGTWAREGSKLKRRLELDER
jgi:hypothetical protein